MKMKYFFLVSCLALMALPASAGKAVNTEDHTAGTVLMEDMLIDRAAMREARQMDRQLLRVEKRMYKTEKRVVSMYKMANEKMAKSKNKRLGGLNDPVDKWFWYWLIAWGVAFLMNVLFWSLATSGVGFFSGGWIIVGLLSTLLWLAGTVFFIVWLVNKLG